MIGGKIAGSRASLNGSSRLEADICPPTLGLSAKSGRSEHFAGGANC